MFVGAEGLALLIPERKKSNPKYLRTSFCIIFIFSQLQKQVFDFPENKNTPHCRARHFVLWEQRDSNSLNY